MSSGAGPATRAARHARRLLRWYPGEWRARYGEEFAELLVADICERPRCWRRDADVALSGVVARLGGAGLSGHQLEPAEQARRSLAAVGWAGAVFLALGGALWAQLGIGWQWARPGTTAATAPIIVMSGAAVVLAALTVAAAGPAGWILAVRIAQRRADGLLCPVLLLLASAAVLVAGTRHFANGWPGTGGHSPALHGLVPAGAAAFTWAATLSVSAYWAHPAALLAFPPGEVAWMAASPLALAGLMTGAVTAMRRADLPSRLLAYLARLGQAAAVAMTVFLAGSCAWIAGRGQRGLFHAGIIDVAAVLVMAVALGVAGRGAQLAGQGASALRAR